MYMYVWVWIYGCARRENRDACICEIVHARLRMPFKSLDCVLLLMLLSMPAISHPPVRTDPPRSPAARTQPEGQRCLHGRCTCLVVHALYSHQRQPHALHGLHQRQLQSRPRCLHGRCPCLVAHALHSHQLQLHVLHGLHQRQLQPRPR